MRVLQINSKVNVGSVSRITDQIGATILETGWESFIAYGRECRRTLSETIKIEGRFSVYFHALGSLLFDAEGRFSSLATKRLIKVIKRIDPDIVHLQNIHGHYLNYSLLFKYLKESGKPVIWTFHDCWPITGHCSHFISCNCEKWKIECHNCPIIRSYPKSLFIDNSRSNYLNKKRIFTEINNLTIVAVSKWLSSVVEQSFLRDKSVEVIYNGIDTTVFNYVPSTLKCDLGLTDKIVLLGVATAWGVEKGLYDYIKLASVLDDRFRIVLVGLNEEQMKSIPNFIIKIPRTANLHELAMYYSMADIVLNLSYAESFGLTTVEGMSCGTPGIVYNRTASPELVSEDTGIIVDAGSIDQLYSAITKISSRGKSFYSDNCRNRVLELFDKSKNYKKYIDLYRQLIK